MKEAPSVSARAPGCGPVTSPEEKAQEGFLHVLGGILADNSSLLMSVGPEGPMFGMKKSPTVIAFGDTWTALRWSRMSPRERALWVARDLRKAAACSSSHESKIRKVSDPSRKEAIPA